MTSTFGTATASDDGSTWEIRVFDEGTLVRTFLNSVVAECTIKDSAAKISYAEGELTLDGAFHLPILTNGAHIEIWHATEGEPQQRRFRGRLECVTSSAADALTTMAFQARAVAAAIVDARFKGEIGTTLDTVVSRLAEAAGLRALTNYPETALSVWVNANSSYGVLRLLAANLGAVVRTQDDLVEFRSNEAQVARMNGPPAGQINTRDVQSSRTVQGRPIKK